MNWHAALVSMPAFAVVLIGGWGLGDPLPAVIVAASAYSIAFGANRRLGGRPWTAMIVTGAGMTVAAFAGTLAGLDPVVEVLGAASMAAFAGAWARIDDDRSWAWLQVTIAFLLAAASPGDLSEALRRATLVVAGAASQLIAVRIMIALTGELPIVSSPQPAPSASDVRLHALRAAICVSAAMIASRALYLQHGYWAPMAAMIVLKPGLRDTWTRGVARIIGTASGIVVATCLVAIAGHRPPALIALAIAAATLSYGLMQAHYAVFSVPVTMSVILLLAVAGAPVIAADLDRLLATLLGGIVAIAGATIAPRRLTAGRIA